MTDITNENIREILSFIKPAELSYLQWVNIGMALKDAGFDCSVWNEWSKNDSRFHEGECEKKWKTFGGSVSSPVTMATVMQMAKEGGYSAGHELDWDSEIGEGAKNDYAFAPPIAEPNMGAAQQIITYLETLFESDETVGFVTKAFERSGKYMPSKGSYSHTCGELIEQLGVHGDDIGAVLGDYNKQAGAWIRFNPLDGKGVKNENVTDFRYALVESDTMSIEEQNKAIRQLELPVAALVHSGGKSLHAIVKIEAATSEEYRKRVDFLYSICRKKGLEIDSQNRNPSRLSRLPGVERNGKRQFLAATNIGKGSWKQWQEWIEKTTDDLPDPESLADFWGNMPELAPPLIENVLRRGHKMLISGPSKAGKSYALIELCCAIAEGTKWLSFNCARGKVLYVNLELDRASCFHRFRDVYTALKLPAKNLGNIDIWNLRGKSVPMDKLAPKLIQRAAKKNYIAIIIDPIYKVITGDENSADQMAAFCNQFDKVCTELKAAVIYCHHHSKGAQGGKRSMDRASGSGVFARDPDAILDLAELEIPESLNNQTKNNITCDVCVKWLSRFKGDSWHDDLSQDDLCSGETMLAFCRDNLPPATNENIKEELKERFCAVDRRSAWRIEGTLREFPKFAPLNCFFEYPVHTPDRSGALRDIEIEDGFNSKKSPYKNNFSKKKSKEQKKKDRSDALVTAYDACKIDGQVTVSELCDYLGKSDKTVRRYIEESEMFSIENNIVVEE